MYVCLAYMCMCIIAYIDISLDSDIKIIFQFCYPCSDEGSDTAAETSVFIIIINYFYVGIQGYINIRITVRR